MSNFRLVMDVSAEDNDQVKLRYAWYDTLEAAQLQAEHELATPEAVDRYRAHYGRDDLELHPSGVRVIGIEDTNGTVVWEPKKKRRK